MKEGTLTKEEAMLNKEADKIHTPEELAKMSGEKLGVYSEVIKDKLDHMRKYSSADNLLLKEMEKHSLQVKEALQKNKV
ncbi:MAG: hypothetical protein KAS39_02340 [Actinomycetia bacterium]|nr:hypothetical protein [Actinomycetes bacterium]